MAYADRNVSGSRIVAVIIVAIIVAGLGYAFVTGLAMSYIKKAKEDLNAFDVKDPPPPPEEVPPPPPDKPVPPPPTQLYVPQSVIPPVNPPPNTTSQSQQQMQQPVDPGPPQPTPQPSPQPPAGPPAVPPKPPTPRGQPQNWVTSDDYPAAALREEKQGTTGVRLSIDASGRVSGCDVTSSSGSSALDAAACRLLKSRGRFNPATDSTGAKVPGVWSNRFRWELPR